MLLALALALALAIATHGLQTERHRADAAEEREAQTPLRAHDWQRAGRIVTTVAAACCLCPLFHPYASPRGPRVPGASNARSNASARRYRLAAANRATPLHSSLMLLTDV
ncbi:hypothetical protein K490DRAFT_57656 [Saccharata proteae CBS 121410]|uniref:Secreted protein n=1 Tax=Saccharata proteae CBS 121410 TaxID=1314787 RepID=A0A9P4HW76_9PEZI|nr:hypothetical protein K490DRAFT_57656 [Saccharata proteae CBS 121410]